MSLPPPAESAGGGKLFRGDHKFVDVVRSDLQGNDTL